MRMMLLILSSLVQRLNYGVSPRLPTNTNISGFAKFTCLHENMVTSQHQ